MTAQTAPLSLIYSDPKKLNLAAWGVRGAAITMLLLATTLDSTFFLLLALALAIGGSLLQYRHGVLTKDAETRRLIDRDLFIAGTAVGLVSALTLAATGSSPFLILLLMVGLGLAAVQGTRIHREKQKASALSPTPATTVTEEPPPIPATEVEAAEVDQNNTN